MLAYFWLSTESCIVNYNFPVLMIISYNCRAKTTDNTCYHQLCVCVFLFDFSWHRIFVVDLLWRVQTAYRTCRVQCDRRVSWIYTQHSPDQHGCAEWKGISHIVHHSNCSHSKMPTDVLHCSIQVHTGRSNINHTHKCTVIFQLSFKQEQNWLLRVKTQLILSVWANFIVYF